MEIDKKQFKDEKGRYIVQGIFLEDRYNTDLAVYTTAGEDKLYKGKLYPSLKRLYLDEGDVEEYLFATKYLFDWPHWKRLCKNAVIRPQIEEWREELELSLRSEGMQTMVNLAVNDNYQAAKFLVDKGWVKNSVGRPKKEEGQDKILADMYNEDLTLLQEHTKGKIQ